MKKKLPVAENEKRRIRVPACRPAALLGIFGFALVVFLSMYYPSLDAGFDHRDDHELLRFAAPFKLHPDLPDSFGPPDSMYSITVTRDHGYGRMRYLYHLARFAQVALFGADAGAWHAVQVGIGVLTCFFLYLGLWRAGMSWAASGLVVVWTVAQQGAGEAWFRLGPSEIYGMLFLAVALFATVEASLRGGLNSWDWMAVAAAACMGLSKEPFILLTPLLAAFRIGFDAHVHGTDPRKVVRVIWPAVLALGALFAVQLTLAVIVFREGTYSRNVVSQVDDPYSPAIWWEMLRAAAPRYSYFIPLLCAGFAGAWALFRKRPPNWGAIGAMLLALAAIGSQLPFMRVEWFDNRYFYPAAFGLALLSGIALDRVRDRRLLVVVSAACLVAAIPAAARTLARTSQFTAHTVALNRMFDYARVGAGPDRELVLYANPATRFENSISAVVFLGYRGVKAPVHLYPAGNWDAENQTAISNMSGQFRNRVDESDLDHGFIQQFESQHGRRPGASVSPADVGAIVMLHTQKEFAAAPPSWYRPGEWEIRRFQEFCWYSGGFWLHRGAGREHAAAVRRFR